METENTPESRTYVVGLPVIVTVSPEGYVTAEVDLSDLGMSIERDEFDTGHPEAVLALDAKLADAWAEQHSVRNEGWLSLPAIPESVRATKRATFEVHAHPGDDKWTLYRRLGNGWLRWGQYADVRAAIKAGEAL